MRRLARLALAAVVSYPAVAGADAPGFTLVASGGATSLRGVSVVDSRIAWVCGSNGRVAVTRDAGATWRWLVVEGYERRDFRDVEAFSGERALLVAVGSPGLVLETVDGGRTWSERLRDSREGIFFDALARRGNELLLAGDPLDGRFVLYRSRDGGKTFAPLAGPEALPGEAAFAASGAALAAGAAGEWALGTGGGAEARVLVSSDAGTSWRASETPLAAGAPSRGIFSLVSPAPGVWIAVGGDYREETEGRGTAAISTDGGARFAAARPLPAGYRSAVVALADGTLLATGPSGSDLSTDGGRGWRSLGGAGFHSLGRSPAGDLVLAVGAGGRIARGVAAALIR